MGALSCKSSTKWFCCRILVISGTRSGPGFCSSFHQFENYIKLHAHTFHSMKMHPTPSQIRNESDEKLGLSFPFLNLANSKINHLALLS